MEFSNIRNINLSLEEFVSDKFTPTENKKEIIIAPPGSGKNVWASKILSENPKAHLVMHTISNKMQFELINKNIVSQVHQFEHIWSIPEDAELVIIDEIDILYNSFFRGLSVLNAIKFINQCECKVIGMTGTMIKEFMILENVDLTVFVKPHGRELRFIEVKTKGPVLTVDIATNVLYEAYEAHKDQYKLMGFVNSKAKGLEIEANLRKKGIKAIFISRDHIPKDMNDLLEYGTDALDYDVFIVTMLFNAGLSFNNLVTVTFNDTPEIIHQQQNRQRAYQYKFNGELVIPNHNGAPIYAPSYHVGGTNNFESINMDVKNYGSVFELAIKTNLLKSGEIDTTAIGYYSACDAYESMRNYCRLGCATSGILERLQNVYGWKIVPYGVIECHNVKREQTSKKKSLVELIKKHGLKNIKVAQLEAAGLCIADYNEANKKIKSLMGLFEHTCLDSKATAVFCKYPMNLIDTLCVIANPVYGKSEMFKTDLQDHIKIAEKTPYDKVAVMAKEFWNNYLAFGIKKSHTTFYREQLVEFQKVYKETEKSSLTFHNRINSLKNSLNKKGIEYVDFCSVVGATQKDVINMTKEEWKNARTNYIQKMCNR